MWRWATEGECCEVLDSRSGDELWKTSGLLILIIIYWRHSEVSVINLLFPFCVDYFHWYKVVLNQIWIIFTSVLDYRVQILFSPLNSFYFKSTFLQKTDRFTCVRVIVLLTYHTVISTKRVTSRLYYMFMSWLSYMGVSKWRCRGSWWSSRREGCSASDHSLRLHVNICRFGNNRYLRGDLGTSPSRFVSNQSS